MLGANLSLFFIIILILFPFIALALGSIVYLLSKRLMKKRKYTLKSLIWPFSFKQTIIENLSDIFINPFVWVFEISLVSLVILLILIIDLVTFSLVDALLIFFASGIIAFIFPVIYGVSLWLLDFKESESFKIMFSLFLWGSCTAFFAIIISTLLQIPFTVALPSDTLALTFFSMVLIAPIVEETVKGAGLFVIALNHEMKGVVDGILYGAIVGFGFAFIENWVYFALNVNVPILFEEWILVVILRSFLSAIGHGIFTGAMGGVLGFLKGRYSDSWFLGIVPGLVIAILLHSMFNLSLLVFDSIISEIVGFPLPLFATGLILVTFIVLSIIYGVNLLHVKFKVKS